ncbi:MAG: DUF6804 family protein [bacterium]
MIPPGTEDQHAPGFGRGFVIARFVCAALLLWALFPHEYGFFTLLRLVVTGVGIYCVHVAHVRGRTQWAWTFGIVVLVFNPVIPWHLGRSIWRIVDAATAVLFLYSIQSIRARGNKFEAN